MKTELRNCYIHAESLGLSSHEQRASITCSLFGYSVSVGPYRASLVDSIGIFVVS